MSRSSNWYSPEYKESLFSAVSAGFFFILVGAIFVHAAFISNINLFDRILAFFGDFEIVKVPHTEVLLLPAPQSLKDHLAVYSAVAKFSIIWGLYQIAILVLRLVAHSPITKKAETASNVVFWLGASYLINTFLIDTSLAGRTVWFAFWAQIITLVGISLIVKAVILLFRT